MLHAPMASRLGSVDCICMLGEHVTLIATFSGPGAKKGGGGCHPDLLAAGAPAGGLNVTDVVWPSRLMLLQSHCSLMHPHTSSRSLGWNSTSGTSLTRTTSRCIALESVPSTGCGWQSLSKPTARPSICLAGLHMMALCLTISLWACAACPVQTLLL